MKPNTAASVLLLAASIAARSRTTRAPGLAHLLNVGALAVAAAALFEYGSGHSLGIDQRLAHVPSERAGDPPAGMSVGTALNGSMLAAALLARGRLPGASMLLADLSGVLSLSALAGFLFDAAPLLGVPVLRSMAIRTAVCLVVLGAAYFCLRPHREPARSLLHSARHHRSGS